MKKSKTKVVPQVVEEPAVVAREFQAGDVVKLRSDGPEMTVVSVSDDSLSVIWFQQTDSNQWISERMGSFKKVTLKLVQGVDEVDPY